MKWDDTSSHSQGDKERLPNRFETRIGAFRLVIHRHIHYPPDQWLASCHPNMFSCFELCSKDLESAKCQAVARLQSILLEAIEQITSNKGAE